MNAPQTLDTGLAPSRIDQRVYLHGVPWPGYESLIAMRGDSSATRVTYLEGEIELMTPSLDHEDLRTRLARLLFAYAEETGIELEAFGSWTIRNESQSRGAEADECFVLGPLERAPEIPDLAIEVIRTSGGIDKLEVYRGLGVPEVWIWQAGTLRIFVLDGGSDGANFVQSPRSRFLPDLDPDLIVRCMGAPSQTKAVRELRAAMRA
jgi:Uma2 family endonuclease